MPPAGDRRCPVCRAALWAPDSETLGTRKCPRCGAELCWLMGSQGPIFVLRQPGQSEYQVLALLGASLFGIPVDKMEVIVKGADSLDLVEIVRGNR